MTALAANKKRLVRNVEAMQRVGTVLQADSKTLYEGSIASNDGAGKITNGADTAGHRIAGISATNSVSGASNTTIKPELEFGHEEWIVQDGGITAAMVGKDAVVLDDGTLSKSITTTNDVPAGIIVELETINSVAGVWCRIGVYSGTLA